MVVSRWFFSKSTLTDLLAVELGGIICTPKCLGSFDRFKAGL